MEILILFWIVIAHIIYIPIAIKTTNSSTFDLNYELITEYVKCLFWPLILIFGITYVMYYLLLLIFLYLDKGWNYLGDIYWDIKLFYYFLLTIKKP